MYCHTSLGSSHSTWQIPLINISNGGLWNYDLPNKGLTRLIDSRLTHEIMIVHKYISNVKSNDYSPGEGM